MGVLAGHIDRMGLEPDATAALHWLNDRAHPYPPGIPLHPLRRAEGSENPRRLVALRFITRITRTVGDRTISRIHWHTEDGAGELTGADHRDLGDRVAATLLTKRNRGALFVVGGGARGGFELFITGPGRRLVELGYQLQPIIRGSRVAWLIIRRSKHSWILSDPATVTGSPASILEAYALRVGAFAGGTIHPAASLYAALVAWQTFLLTTYGVAMRPTVATTALQCARRWLPEGEWIWPCSPLLASFERNGHGYRGGLQTAQSYRGPAHRVDVNRQYAGALAGLLPLRTAFGRYNHERGNLSGIYLCQLRGGMAGMYPVGVWRGPAAGYRYESSADAGSLCILHGTEIEALRRSGADIAPLAGFTYTATFTLAPYVAKLQSVLDQYGRESPEARLSKPLGNMVYGKLGESPDQTQLLFALSDPGDEWAPYVDLDGNDWPGLWEVQRTRYASHQHVDVAGEITALGRAQTLDLARWLDACGAGVVRIHTDSVTTIRDPRPFIVTDDRLIGWPRYEGYDAAHVIATANGYTWMGAAHLAGVTAPTVDAIELLQSGEPVQISQQTYTLPWVSNGVGGTVERTYQPLRLP